jgi:glycosyltransferase involved in cell wall biosynthesis
VIPVYNEGDNIRALFDAIRAALGTDIEILICYDFEEDTSLPPVRERMAEFPNTKLVLNKYGRGPLGAIKSGFEAAKSDAVVVTMADLSDDLTCIHKMMELYEQGCDLVCGSRYMRGGRQSGGPLVKRTLSRMAGISLSFLGRVGTRDATNSFKLYSKKLLESVRIESTGGFELGIEMVVKAHLAGFVVGEVPTAWIDRTAGKSRFKLMKWLPHYLRWYWLAIRK